MIQSAGICLDTDVCVDYLRRRAADGRSSFEALPVASVWISAVTLGELRYGAHRSRHRATEDARLADLLSAVRVRAFDVRAAEVAAAVRAQLEARGQRIGALDTLIGAHALAEGAALMTRNAREFSRIQGLVIAEV